MASSTDFCCDGGSAITAFARRAKLNIHVLPAGDYGDSALNRRVNCALKPRHNKSVTWPFSEATCQIIGCAYFRRRSSRMSSDVWSSGEALAAVSKQLGIARKLLYEWRWAWRRHGAAGLNRRRGPKAGLRRKIATGDPPGAALASSAPSAEGTSAPVAELARAKARIEELERLVGRQQLDLDFFRKALRLADALQGPAPARGETNSTRSSKI